MKKEPIIGIIVVFVLWVVMDFLIHGLLLSATYEATASLWRPMEEMNMGVIQGSVFVSAICFTLIYELGFSAAALKVSALFGLLFGVGVGAGLGFGTYAVMPIPFGLAFAWFAATAVEALAAALALHWVYKARKS